MIKLYYLSMYEGDPAAFYRTTGVLPYLNHKDIQVKNIWQSGVFDWHHLVGATHFLFQRPYHEHHVNLIYMAKDMGIKVIAEYDDDLLNVPFHNNASITLEEQKKNIKRAIHESDEVWVTTPAIQKVYSPYNKNIHIIPNAHNDYIHPVSKKRAYNKESKIMSYRGGASHEADMYQNINDLISMMDANKDWEFRFQGSGAFFKFINNRSGNNHTCTEPNTIMQFFKNYHDLNAPLAFFPLLNNKFNCGKSNISLLEATYSGSAFMGNKNLPEFGYDFVTDISSGVYLPFMELKDDRDKQERMNKEAWEWIMENRLLSNVNKLREERLLW